MGLETPNKARSMVLDSEHRGLESSKILGPKFNYLVLSGLGVEGIGQVIY